MNNFDGNFSDLRLYLENYGDDDPDATIARILKALNTTLELIPGYSKKSKTICLPCAVVFGVQKFVTQYGCHLKFIHITDGHSCVYEIIPNWK